MTDRQAIAWCHRGTLSGIDAEMIVSLARVVLARRPVSCDWGRPDDQIAGITLARAAGLLSI